MQKEESGLAIVGKIKTIKYSYIFGRERATNPTGTDRYRSDMEAKRGNQDFSERQYDIQLNLQLPCTLMEKSLIQQPLLLPNLVIPGLLHIILMLRALKRRVLMSVLLYLCWTL